MSDQEVMISQNEIIENGKIFKISTYNNIEIIIDTETGYVNATKLCKNENKDFRTFCKSMRYSELVELFNKENTPEQKCAGLKYELKSQFSPQIRGQYIHPDFINFVCEWCSLEYAYKVAKIMNTINDELHLRNIDLQTKIDEMKEEVERLEFENKDLCLPINRLRGGYVYIVKTTVPNEYRITSRSIRLIDQHNVAKEFKLTNYDDVKKILIKNVPYLHNVINYIGFGIYEIPNLDLVEDIIDEIKNNTFVLENYVNTNNTFDKEFENIKQYCISSKNRYTLRCRCGKLYEYYFVSTNNDLKLWKSSSQAFRNKYNEVCSDHGIDVINEKNKAFYQLKYYPKMQLNYESIKSFVKFVSNFDDKSYTYNLVVPSSCIIDDLLLSKIEELNINVIRFDSEEMEEFIASWKEPITITSYYTVKNPQERTMEYVEFIKSIYDNRKNNNITKRLLAQLLNEKYGTSYEKSAISHYQKILFNKYPEYENIWINENKQQQQITRFIKNNWIKEDSWLKDEILKRFNYEMSTHSIDTRRRSIKTSTIEELPLKPTEVRKSVNDKIKEWLIKPENWYNTIEWKIKRIRELFNVDKTDSSIRHLTLRLMEKYSNGIKVINPETGEEEVTYLRSPYKKDLHQRINQYVAKNKSLTDEEMKMKIKELFNYDITDKGLKSRRLRYK